MPNESEGAKMLRFNALYEDWEDERSGNFSVKARNILEAYHKAWSHIHSLSHGGLLELITELKEPSLQANDTENKVYYPEFIEQYVAKLKRFILLSGPSGEGKTPLRESAATKVKFERGILYTSREQRDNEIDGIDYHFRPVDFIKSLKPPRYIVGPVRNMWQAIDLQEIHELFNKSNMVYVEAYHTLGSKLKKNLYLPQDVIPISVFMSPLSAKEIADLTIGGIDLETHITDLTRDKLKFRSDRKGKPYDSLNSNEQRDIEIKAKDAFSELGSACQYDYVLVNHDGEGHSNWKNLSGDAGRSVEAFIRILKFGIYRPHISIEELPDGELKIGSTATYAHKEKAIEHWNPGTIKGLRNS